MKPSLGAVAAAVIGSQTMTTNHLLADDTADTINGLKQQIEQLDQKVRILERNRELEKETADVVTILADSGMPGAQIRELNPGRDGKAGAGIHNLPIDIHRIAWAIETQRVAKAPCGPGRAIDLSGIAIARRVQRTGARTFVQWPVADQAGWLCRFICPQW